MAVRNMIIKCKNIAIFLILYCMVFLPFVSLESANKDARWLEIGKPVFANHTNTKDSSKNGNTYSENILELRIYRTEDIRFNFYNFHELKEKKLIFKSMEKEIIARIMRSANMGPAVGERSYCRRLIMDYQLHVVALEEGEQIYGYFIVAPNEAAQDAPSNMIGNCASVTFSDVNLHGWHSYDFFAELRALGIL